LILIFNTLDLIFSEVEGALMIVCHCFCVSDREIRVCAREGACSVTEVGRASGAGTGCGGCRPEIASILDGERQQQQVARPRDVVSLPVLRSA
jgi:bacterioferritin-associated ferredoxin